MTGQCKLSLTEGKPRHHSTRRRLPAHTSAAAPTAGPQPDPGPRRERNQRRWETSGARPPRKPPRLPASSLATFTRVTPPTDDICCSSPNTGPVCPGPLPRGSSNGPRKGNFRWVRQGPGGGADRACAGRARGRNAFLSPFF